MSHHSASFSAAVLAAIALCGATPARAADACEEIKRASAKIWEIPVHLYITHTAPSRKNPTRMSESIYTGGANGAVYVMINGKWTRSHITIAELKAGQAEVPQTAKHTCRYERDEAVNGEPAAVYFTHGESEDGKTDITVWISKSRNLPLKSEVDVDLGGAAGKSHSSTRYEYSNVQAPPGVN